MGGNALQIRERESKRKSEKSALAHCEKNDSVNDLLLLLLHTIKYTDTHTHTIGNCLNQFTFVTTNCKLEQAIGINYYVVMGLAAATTASAKHNSFSSREK